MKTILLLLVLSAIGFAQTFKVVELKGEVKFQTGTEEGWTGIEEGSLISNESVIATGRNSTVKLLGGDFSFKLKENSALSIRSIKKMTMDELLLALAMEDLINSPKKNENGTSDNTAVYGSDDSAGDFPDLESSPFGLKRLNGAKQLAEGGLEESAIVFAKETYRKYPDVKSIPSYRIYFANVLYNKRLYEEALKEYKEIGNLQLNDTERKEVEFRIEDINKVLLSQ